MKRYRPAIIIVCGLLLFAALIILFVQSRAKPRAAALRRGMAEVSMYTGLQFPAGSRVMNYSSGWDERYLKLQLNPDDISQLLSSVDIERQSTMPKEIDGMNPLSVTSWWHPKSLSSFSVYEGALQGTTNAHGRFFVVIEDANNTEQVVYVYFFKT